MGARSFAALACDGVPPVNAVRRPIDGDSDTALLEDHELPFIGAGGNRCGRRGSYADCPVSVPPGNIPLKTPIDIGGGGGSRTDSDGLRVIARTMFIAA